MSSVVTHLFKRKAQISQFSNKIDIYFLCFLFMWSRCSYIWLSFHVVVLVTFFFFFFWILLPYRTSVLNKGKSIDNYVGRFYGQAFAFWSYSICTLWCLNSKKRLGYKFNLCALEEKKIDFVSSYPVCHILWCLVAWLAERKILNHPQFRICLPQETGKWLWCFISVFYRNALV